MPGGFLPSGGAGVQADRPYPRRARAHKGRRTRAPSSSTGPARYLQYMSALAVPPAPLTRRKRAAQTVSAALRGGLAGAIAATVGWLVAGAIAGTAFVLLIVATLAVGGYVV